MLSGREALASIDRALAEVRAQVREVASQAQRTSEQIVKLRQLELEQYQALAKLRIGLMATGELATNLDQAHQTAQRILGQRDAALEDLDRQVEVGQQQRAELESRRLQAAAAVASADESRDQALAATQARLAEDPSYQQQLASAQAADRIADHAEEKTRIAELDRSEKGQPYEQDPLFRYLWERGYGTADYRASRLTRRLDAWVARLCGYQDARPNYATLLEIPARLREHAATQRARAESELQRLQSMERAAAEADGVPALEQALADAQANLDAVDEEIEAAEASHRQMLDERARFAAGKDPLYQQAVALLSSHFSRADLGELRRDAELTPLPDDDVVVERLAAVEGERLTLESASNDHRGMLARHQQRLQELEHLRRQFKRHRYDSNASLFPDGALIALLLNEFLRGVLGSDNLWREIERNHRMVRRHADPGFGSGSIGKGRRRGPWGGGGFGGGGFGTGGGLGGGGFRTGGGF